jgi:hypothetical protein
VERHKFDPLSLLFGALFAAVGLLLIAGAGMQLVTGSWIAPAAAIIFGIVLLIAAPRAARPDAGETSDVEAEDAAPA